MGCVAIGWVLGRDGAEADELKQSIEELEDKIKHLLKSWARLAREEGRLEFQIDARLEQERQNYFPLSK
jgi:ElaB/YqjD/DUF883 family membrane-anchored ribosome-binding protein